MNVIESETWANGWEDRIRRQLSNMNFKTVKGFLASRPNVPLHKVAKDIASNVAPVQLAIILLCEAIANAEVKAAAADLLCRVIHSNLRKGWKSGLHAERMMAGAYSEWLSTMEFRSGVPELREFALATWMSLEGLSPNCGWLPSGPNDSLLANAIETGWQMTIWPTGDSDTSLS